MKRWMRGFTLSMFKTVRFRVARQGCDPFLALQTLSSSQVPSRLDVSVVLCVLYTALRSSLLTLLCECETGMLLCLSRMHFVFACGKDAIDDDEGMFPTRLISHNPTGFKSELQ